MKKLLAVLLVISIVFVLVGCKSNEEKLSEETNIDISDDIQVEEIDKTAQAADTEVTTLTQDESYTGELRPTTMYLINEESGAVEAVTLNIEKVEGIARAAINLLRNKPIVREKLAGKGFIPVLPEETEIIGLTIRDGLAKIDFNGAFKNAKTVKEEQDMVKSVVLTLLEFKTVQKVQIMVEGKILDKLPFGTNIGKPLVKSDISW